MGPGDKKLKDLPILFGTHLPTQTLPLVPGLERLFRGRLHFAGAVGMLKCSATTFDIVVDARDCPTIGRSVRLWKEERACDPVRAPPLTRDVLDWLEEAECDPDLMRAGRLLAARLRPQAGASGGGGGANRFQGFAFRESGCSPPPFPHLKES